MDEVIDQIKREHEDEPVYLKKSARLFKINTRLIILSIVASVFIKPLFQPQSGMLEDFLDLFVGLPIFIMLFLAPVGLFYSWKSYRRKEGNSRTRFKYGMGHLFFCLLIILCIGVVLGDLLIAF